MLKELLKDTKFIIYFLVMQTLGCLGIILYKLFFNSSFYDKIIEFSVQGDFLSPEYLALIGETIVPSLILADILVIIPFIIKSLKSGDKMVHFNLTTLGYLDFIAIGILLNVLVSGIVEALPQQSNALTEYTQMVNQVISGNFFLSLLSAGILAPICEELIFRYGMIGKDANKTIAIIISALLFGLAHFNLVQSTYAFALGLFFGYIYTREYNLLHTIILHMVINGTSVLYEFFGQSTLGMVITIVIVLISAGYVMYRWSRYMLDSDTKLLA